MATYVIGDVQGCYDELLALLHHIEYDRRYDILWFTGDLVNRGPKSLETLRFVRTLGKQGVTVLGNHDIHLLAVHAGVRAPNEDDTLTELLSAPDGDMLIDWLREQPLLHRDIDRNMVLVHAGIPPGWNISKAIACAKEAETALTAADSKTLLTNLFSNEPDTWDDKLTGWDRVRFIINAFTRLLFCDAEGRLDLTTKGGLGEQPPGMMPWYVDPARKMSNTKIIFGHWATLQGNADASNVEALDTGCVWGNCLTAYCLDNNKRYSVSCHHRARGK